MTKVNTNGIGAANNGAHTHTLSTVATIGARYTVADVAAMLELKAQPNGKYHGAPGGTGATKDGFILCPEGNAFTNGGDKFTSEQVAELAGIEPGQYEPIAAYRNGRAPLASNGTGTQPRRATKPQSTPNNAATPKAPKLPPAPFDWTRAQTFDYTDESGALLFQVGRCDAPDCEKSIRQRQPNGRGGWIGKLDGARRVLWRLPDVLRAETVWLCEGEKAAMALNDAFERARLFGRHVATTNPHGAGKWRDEYAAPLDGKAVAMLPDFDEPGDRHGAAVCASIYARGQSLELKRLELPGLPEKGDVCDWIDAGGDVAQLLELFERARQWESDREPATEETAPRFNFSTLAQLRQRPAPQWLIERLLTRGGTSLLTAKHASFKSFFALDMALCVATGTPWHGFDVAPGPVVYIAAEGAAGLRKRADAWEAHHGADIGENFIVLDVPLAIHEPATRAAFVAELARLSPVLIVLDTLARCAVGLDENNSADMGRFADALGALARDTGAHVLTVHHNNKGGEYRGSSALPAAVDTHLSLERKRDFGSDSVALKTDKQKDFEELETLSFEGRSVALPGTGGAEHSLIFERLESRGGSAYSLSDLEEKTLEELVAAFGDDGATASQWCQLCLAALIPARTFHRAKERLVKIGAVLCPNKGEKGAKFTPAPDWCHGANSLPLHRGTVAEDTSLPHCHTPLGVAVSGSDLSGGKEREENRELLPKKFGSDANGDGATVTAAKVAGNFIERTGASAERDAGAASGDARGDAAKVADGDNGDGAALDGQTELREVHEF